MFELIAFTWFFPAIGLPILGFILFAYWMSDINSMPFPQEAELTKASHGVGVIVCGAYLLYVVPIPEKYQFEIHSAYAFLCVMGVFWLFIGSARAQIYGDARLIGRAIGKFAFGFIVWGAWKYWIFDATWGWRSWLEPMATVIALWCWTTGVVQFIISSRRRPRLQLSGNPGSYGTSDFPDDPTGLTGSGRR
jgi:hypothetical protein